MSDENCTGNVLLAFLAGAVVGASIALLTTPKTGDQVREELAGYGNQFRDQVNRGYEDLRGYADKVRGRAEKVVEEVAEKVTS